MDSPDVSTLRLHDALLSSITIVWERKACRFDLLAFAAPGTNAAPHVLEFFGVTSVTIPHQEPWGPSSSINSISCSQGQFRIEMQSGDIIELSASHFTFSAL